MPLAAYFQEINRTPLLNAEEERELAYRVAGGDAEARDRLVRANLRLVVRIARGYAGRGLPMADLISEGNLGLLRAVEGFDPAVGTRFSTYASYWIKQSIKRGVLNTARTVRLPAYVAEVLAKWRRAAARLQDELGRAPTEEEVARRLGLRKKKLAIIKSALRIHNGGPQGAQDGAGPSIDDVLADARAGVADDSLASAEELRGAVRRLDGLGERPATVLRLRFGLGGEGPLTLQEIGDRLGLTRERVRQIEERSLADLAKMIQAV